MWLYNGSELKDSDIPEKSIGFIYKITYLLDGRWYIGRKNLKKTAYKTVKGKKKKIMVDSDWKDYWSSSDDVKTLVIEKGEAQFTKEILLFTDSASQTLYAEEALLYKTHAILDPKCFNNNIRSKVYRKWFTDPKNIRFVQEISNFNLTPNI